MDTIANRIKRIRENRGYTQKTLGERAGMIEAQIQKYEFGTIKPKSAQLLRIAEALDVDVSFLIPTSADTPYGIFALLYNLTQIYDDVVLENVSDNIMLGIDADKHPSEHQLLLAAKKAHDNLNIEDFREWLICEAPYSETDVLDRKPESNLPHITGALNNNIELKALLRDFKFVFQDGIEAAQSLIKRGKKDAAIEQLDLLLRTATLLADKELDK